MKRIIAELANYLASGAADVGLREVESRIGRARLRVLAARLLRSLSGETLPMRIQMQWEWPNDFAVAALLLPELRSMWSLENATFTFAPLVTDEDREIYRRYTEEVHRADVII